MKEQLIFSSEEHHAKISQSLEREKDSMGSGHISQSTLFDLLINSDVNGSCGRMFSVYSVLIPAQISQPFYPCLPDARLESPNKDLQHPDLFALLDGIDSPWHGECWMLNLPEFPDFPMQSRSDAGVCSLSDILVIGDVPQRYYLSRNACLGLIRSASKSGKDLPKILKDILKRQAQSECELDDEEEERELW